MLGGGGIVITTVVADVGLVVVSALFVEDWVVVVVGTTILAEVDPVGAIVVDVVEDASLLEEVVD